MVLYEKDAVILGKQCGGGWSSFGGRSQNKESPLKTAARECHEELRGAIEKTELEKRLKEASNIVSKTPKGYKFICILFHLLVCKLLNRISIDPSHLSRCMQEVEAVQIFKLETINGIDLRPSFKKDIVRTISVIQELA